MSELEIIIRAVVYALAAIAVLVATFWYGWEQRTRLALKLEHFKVTNKAWTDYDAYLRKEGHPPMRAQLHEIHERNSDR